MSTLSAVAEERPSAKPRRRAAAKTDVRPSVQKVKATVCLSVEADRRLSIHAAMLGEDRSTLVEKLILEGLKRFRVSDLDRGSSVDSEDRLAMSA